MALHIEDPEENGAKVPKRAGHDMKTKSRFLSAVVAATREQQMEMPWKRVSSHSVKSRAVWQHVADQKKAPRTKLPVFGELKTHSGGMLRSGV